jgi:UTP--glucose-1-phosphate uridylyltransferase
MIHTKSGYTRSGFGDSIPSGNKINAKGDAALPLIDKPVIQFVVEEAIISGIEDILIITGRGKRAIEDYFDSSPELENHLVHNEKYELLREVKEISSLVDISSII